MSRKRQQVRKEQPVSVVEGLGRWQLLALIAVLLSAGGLLLWLVSRSRMENFTPKVTGAPSIEVGQESVDYGNVKVNTPIETTFSVRNVGDEALIILGEPQVELIEGC
jgi:hypothetical protein